MKRKMVIGLLLLILFSGCESKDDAADTEINQQTAITTTISSSQTETSSNSTDVTQTATEQLESLYNDNQIEYARVVANLAQNGKMGYNVERIEQNHISLIGETYETGKFITIHEQGESDRFISYVAKGDGYIEHKGIRKYTADPNSPTVSTYLKTDYDDIALAILKNS